MWREKDVCVICEVEKMLIYNIVETEYFHLYNNLKRQFANEKTIFGYSKCCRIMLYFL